MEIIRSLSRRVSVSQCPPSDSVLCPTVFIVGDRKQSIYGFREADPDVLDFAKKLFARFEKPVVAMNKSFRTTQPILSFVNRVFQHDSQFPLHTTAHIDDQPFIPECGRIQIFDETYSVQEEAEQVAQWLSQVLSHEISHPVYDANTQTYRQIEPKDVCLMYRNTTHVEHFEESLRKRHIPFIREEKKGFFQRPEIHDAIAWIRLFYDPTDVLSLLSVLKSPWFLIPDQHILKMIQAVHQEQGQLSVETLIIQLEAIDYEASQMIRRYMENSEILYHKIFVQSLEKLQVFETYKQLYSEDHAQLAIQNLRKLINIILNLEETGHTTSRKLLQQLEAMMNEDDHGNAHTHSNAVRLMTIHKSKGLEFPLVMVTQTAQPWYRLDRYWAKDTTSQGIFYTGTAKQQPDQLPEFGSLMEQQSRSLELESWRLLYVALTRSSQFLSISGWKPKRSQPGVKFLDHLKEQCQGYQNSFGQQIEVLPDVPIVKTPLSTNHSTTLELPKSWKDQQDANIVHPHTALQGKQKQARLPHNLPKGMGAVIGTYIHKVLELSVRQQPISEQLWQQDVVRSQAARSLQLTRKSLQHLKEYVETGITKTLNSQLWHTVHSPAFQQTSEMAICARVDHDLIIGTLDLFCESESEVWIIDYKSTPYTPPTKGIHDRTQDYVQFCREHGYFDQLECYKKAVSTLTSKRIRCWVWLTDVAACIEVHNGKGRYCAELSQQTDNFLQIWHHDEAKLPQDDPKPKHE